MIAEFEAALVKGYIPNLVPNLEQIQFATEDAAFYRDSQFTKYPAVLVVREAITGDWCPHYTYVDDSTGTKTICWPYDQKYSIKIYVEKQQEAIDLYTHIRVEYAEHPYVQFYLDGQPIHIGLRLLNMTLTSERDNYDEKGAKRCVLVEFQARLVITRHSCVPIIKRVIVNVKSDGSREVDLRYELSKPNLINRVKLVFNKVKSLFRWKKK